MAVKYVEGFDFFSSVAQMGDVHIIVSETGVSLQTGGVGASPSTTKQFLRTSKQYNVGMILDEPIDAATSTFVVGFWCKVSTPTDTNDPSKLAPLTITGRLPFVWNYQPAPYIGFENTDSGSFKILINGGTTPYFTWQSTGSATSTASYNYDQWYFIEYEVNYSSDIFTVYVDGVQSVQRTGTWSSAYTTVIGLQLGNSALQGTQNSQNIDFDNVYVLDDTGSVNTTRLGKVDVIPVVASSNGASTDWTYTTTSYAYSLNNAGDYIYESTDNGKVSITPEAISGLSNIGNLHATHIRYRMTSPSSRSPVIQTMLQYSTNELLGDKWHVPYGDNSLEHFFSENFDQSAGPTTWTKAVFDATDFGWKYLGDYE